MLSNAILIMPEATRSNAPGTATVFYRCGSQRGKIAQEVSAELSEQAFTDLTVAFVLAQAREYAAAASKKQKNATRGLKKYFDQDDVALIVEHHGQLDAVRIEALLL